MLTSDIYCAYFRYILCLLQIHIVLTSDTYCAYVRYILCLLQIHIVLTGSKFAVPVKCVFAIFTDTYTDSVLKTIPIVLTHHY